MASNNDNMIEVEGGEDKNPKKRRMSAVANDGDDDSNEKKKKNESSTGDSNNSNSQIIRPDTVRSKSSPANTTTTPTTTPTANTPTAAETIPPAITQPSQQEESDAELPTSIELSKVLCKIVDTDHYSRDESLCALKKLSRWSFMEDSKFLKYFAMYGGIIKVLDFLTVILEEHELAIGTNSMECIEFAVSTVGNVCYDRKDGINSDISSDIATTAVKYDKLGTLLRANNECNDFENNTSHLGAVKDIWIAFGNIIACNGILDLVGREQTMHLFDSGMDIIKKLKFINDRHTIAITTNIGGPVFDALDNIFYGTNYVTYNEFKDRNFLPHCLNVFKKDDGTWVYGSEELLQNAIDCIDTCHSKKLFAGIKDYESILPLCTLCLKEFPTNDEIRANVCRLLTGACSSRVNNRTIEKTGVLEDIVPLLTSDMIDDDEKTEWRNIATMITAP